MTTARLRLFAAVPLRDPAQLSWLAAAVGSLRDGGGGRDGASAGCVKWVEPELYHFTLKFLGDVTGEEAERAARALGRAAARSRPFELGLERLGVFPPRGLPRVVWAGCGAGAEELAALAAAVEGEMVAEGFPAEARPFSPHMTLGRVKDPRRAAALSRAVLDARPDPPPPPIPVRRALLLRSELLPAGPKYHEWGQALLVDPEFACSSRNRQIPWIGKA